MYMPHETVLFLFFFHNLYNLYTVRLTVLWFEFRISIPQKVIQRADKEDLDFGAQHQRCSNRKHDTGGGRCGQTSLVDEWGGVRFKFTIAVYGGIQSEYTYCDGDTANVRQSRGEISLRFCLHRRIFEENGMLNWALSSLRQWLTHIWR